MFHFMTQLTFSIFIQLQKLNLEAFYFCFISYVYYKSFEHGVKTVYKIFKFTQFKFE